MRRALLSASRFESPDAIASTSCSYGARQCVRSSNACARSLSDACDMASSVGGIGISLCKSTSLTGRSRKVIARDATWRSKLDKHLVRALHSGRSVTRTSTRRPIALSAASLARRRKSGR